MAANGAILTGIVIAPGNAVGVTTGGTTTESGWKTCTYKIRKTLSATAQGGQHTQAQVDAAATAYAQTSPYPWTPDASPPPPGSPLISGGPFYSGSTPPAPYTETTMRNPNPPTAKSIQAANGSWFVVFDYEIITSRETGTGTTSPPAGE